MFLIPFLNVNAEILVQHNVFCDYSKSRGQTFLQIHLNMLYFSLQCFLLFYCLMSPLKFHLHTKSENTAALQTALTVAWYVVLKINKDNKQMKC